MPCFHFDVGGEPKVDSDGVSLPGIEEARAEAVRLAGTMLADAPSAFGRRAPAGTSTSPTAMAP